jgi:hypothetical protein
MSKRILSCLIGSALVSVHAFAADFKCQDDVVPAKHTPEEQKLVDQFWNESLTYLGQFLKTIETPTGQCKDSAQATVQTYSSQTGKAQTRCVLKYRDVELMAKHLRAILAEPEKAKACFDTQKNYKEFPLYTPSEQTRNLSATAKWLNRPLLTDFYKKMGGEVGKAGLELNENFVAVTSRIDTSVHWAKDVSINWLPTLWSPLLCRKQGRWQRTLPRWLPLRRGHGTMGQPAYQGDRWGNRRRRGRHDSTVVQHNVPIPLSPPTGDVRNADQAAVHRPEQIHGHALGQRPVSSEARRQGLDSRN